MRRYTFIILFALLAVIFAACTDDAPSDTRGCIAEEGQAADEIYDRDEGCHNGNIMHAEGEGHGEEDADADHSEDAEAEGEDHEEDADNDHEEDDGAESDESEPDE